MGDGSELELSEEFLVSLVSSLSKLGCCFLSPQQRHPGPQLEVLRRNIGSCGHCPITAGQET